MTDHIDQEIVRKALECIAEEKQKSCTGCKYSILGLYPFCVHGIARDVLALLKEPEAKNGEWITIWREDDPDTSDHARCSICNMISERPVGGYCKWCGAKMG